MKNIKFYTLLLAACYTRQGMNLLKKKSSAIMVLTGLIFLQFCQILFLLRIFLALCEVTH